MRRLLIIPIIFVVIVLGNQFGWQYVFAPLLGYSFIAWAFASLRSMANGGTPAAVDGENDPQPVLQHKERVLYWCEECGTELLLIMRGSGISPRHCGSKMHERAEILGSQDA